MLELLFETLSKFSAADAHDTFTKFSSPLPKINVGFEIKMTPAIIRQQNKVFMMEIRVLVVEDNFK